MQCSIKCDLHIQSSCSKTKGKVKIRVEIGIIIHNRAVIHVVITIIQPLPIWNKIYYFIFNKRKRKFSNNEKGEFSSLGQNVSLFFFVCVYRSPIFIVRLPKSSLPLHCGLIPPLLTPSDTLQKIKREKRASLN